MLRYADVVINLKLLQRVGKHQKLNTRDIYLNIESRSIIPESIRRWRRGDDRHQTILHINQTVATAIELMPQHDNLIGYLSSAKPGIDNLKETYADCSQTCARLEAIMDTIEQALDAKGETRIVSVEI